MNPPERMCTDRNGGTDEGSQEKGRRTSPPARGPTSTHTAASTISWPAVVTKIHDALVAGVQLWAASCYRTDQKQVDARKKWCDAGQCDMAALPGTSNHGWGRAVDRGEPGGVTFTCRGYRWLKANAGEYGFIGLDTGAWHWDWVGDGGQMHGAPIRPDVWFWFQTH